MPNKINMDKVGGFSPVRATAPSEVKKSGTEIAKPVETSKTGNEDKLDLSNRAAEVGKLVEQVKDMPDSREEKIDRLRDQIAAGEYQPSSEDIADAIIKDEKI